MMYVHSFRQDRYPNRNFDVGSKGISGHYDTMLGHFREHSPKVILVMTIWLWVLFWPRHTVILQLGPKWTLAHVIQLGLLAWTIVIFWPVLLGLFYCLRWIDLEKRGLYAVEKNGQVYRIIYYRLENRQSLHDGMEQSHRFSAERDVNHQRRAALVEEGWHLALALFLLLMIPISLSWIMHHMEPAALKSLARINIDHWAHSTRRSSPEFSRWLMRRDVHGIFSSLTFGGLAMWACFCFLVAKPLTNFGWTVFGGYIHFKGFQYVPGAKVLEGFLKEVTLRDLDDEQVHGSRDFGDAVTAALTMSGKDIGPPRLVYADVTMAALSMRGEE